MVLATILILGFYVLFSLLVFAIGVTPTEIWQKIGASLGALRDKGRAGEAQAALARVAARQAFQPDHSFVALGIGFAFDSVRQLVFLQGRRGETVAETILPLGDIGACRARLSREDGFEENIVDIDVIGAPRGWRISCQQRGDIAEEIVALLASARAPSQG